MDAVDKATVIFVAVFLASNIAYLYYADAGIALTVEVVIAQAVILYIAIVKVLRIHKRYRIQRK